MISPLGKGHRGGTLSITSSRTLYSSCGRGRVATEGCAAGTLGPALAAAIKKAPATEGTATVELRPRVEVPVGGVGPWCTRGLKE